MSNKKAYFKPMLVDCGWGNIPACKILNQGHGPQKILVVFLPLEAGPVQL